MKQTPLSKRDAVFYPGTHDRSNVRILQRGHFFTGLKKLRVMQLYKEALFYSRSLNQNGRP